MQYYRIHCVLLRHKGAVYRQLRVLNLPSDAFKTRAHPDLCLLSKCPYNGTNGVQKWQEGTQNY